jgi:hypothetical protein
MRDEFIFFARLTMLACIVPALAVVCHYGFLFNVVHVETCVAIRLCPHPTRLMLRKNTGILIYRHEVDSVQLTAFSSCSGACPPVAASRESSIVNHLALIFIVYMRMIQVSWSTPMNYIYAQRATTPTLHV